MNTCSSITRYEYSCRSLEELSNRVSRPLNKDNNWLVKVKLLSAELNSRVSNYSDRAKLLSVDSRVGGISNLTPDKRYQRNIELVAMLCS